MKENDITVFTKPQWCHSGILPLCIKCPTCHNFILKPELFGYVLITESEHTGQSSMGCIQSQAGMDCRFSLHHTSRPAPRLCSSLVTDKHLLPWYYVSAA